MNNIWISRSKDRKGCTTLIAKVAALNLGTMASICLFHDSELSIVKPRDCILSTVVVYYVKVTKGIIFCCKIHKVSFSQFKDIRFVLNHSCIGWRILLASSLNFIGSGIQIVRLVSSANRTILLFLFIECGKSFIYRRKSKGPRIDPWGTPWVIWPQSDIEIKQLLFKITLW